MRLLVNLSPGQFGRANLRDSNRMYLGYFKDFKSNSHLVLLSGGSAEFASLRSRMAELSIDDRLSIHELDGVKAVRDTSLEIRITQRDRITRRCLSSFEWEMTTDTLDASLKKVDPLLSDRHPCHQYYVCHPADDAVIMMSVGEYSDLWWDRVATQ